MSEIGTYTFLPWLRSGIANRIETGDLDTSVTTRASVDVELTLKGTGGEGGEVSEPVDAPGRARTARATSSASRPPPSSATSRRTGSPTSSPTTSPTSSSTTRTSPTATRRRHPTADGCGHGSRSSCSPRRSSRKAATCSASRCRSSRSRPARWRTPSRPPTSCGHGPTCTSTRTWSAALLPPRRPTSIPCSTSSTRCWHSSRTWPTHG